MRHNLDKEHLLKLTLAVYKVTALFPAGEELGSKIRELADRVLHLVEHNGASPGGAPIEEILGLFDLAEKKNWVDPRNFFVLRGEYEKVGHAMSIGHRMSNLGKTVPCLPAGRDNSLVEGRQGKILAVMNGNGAVKIGDLVKVFPGVNRRTVLRDLDKLCQTGTLVRNGNGRGIHYTMS